MSRITLPRTQLDEGLDLVIKAGVFAWLVKITFRSNRV